jgi:hypothetical protein
MGGFFRDDNDVYFILNQIHRLPAETAEFEKDFVN